jgi:hypothetical protein
MLYFLNQSVFRKIMVCIELRVKNKFHETEAEHIHYYSYLYGEKAGDFVPKNTACAVSSLGMLARFFPHLWGEHKEPLQKACEVS